MAEQTTFRTTDGEVRPIRAKTAWRLLGTVYDSESAVRNVAGHKWRVHVRASREARALRTYSHSPGGISVQSATYGRLTISVGASDLPPVARGTLDLVGYSGTYTAPICARYRLGFVVD